MEFTFQKRWFGPDGDKMVGGAYNPDVVKESHTFHTVHDAIRFVEKVKRPGRTDYWIAWSLENESMTEWRLADRNLWNVLARVQQRYQRFCFYINSVKDWETVPNSRIYYADNSVEETERNRITGATRQKMLISPHGDIC